MTGKAPIGTRWIDINKGDEKAPEYRSRLVAQEIKRDKREDLFAATPPLEAKKILFSLAVTEGIGWRKSEKEGEKQRRRKKKYCLNINCHSEARFRGFLRSQGVSKPSLKGD